MMTKEQSELLGQWKDVFTQARMHTKPVGPSANETPETIAAAAIAAGMIVAASIVAVVIAQRPLT